MPVKLQKRNGNVFNGFEALMVFGKRFQNISKYPKILLEVYSKIRSNNQHGRMPIGNYWRA